VLAQCQTQTITADVSLQRYVRGAVDSYFGALGVRRAVCAQEEAGAAAHCGAQYCLAVALALQDRQAECVRPQPALQHANMQPCCESVKFCPAFCVELHVLFACWAQSVGG
jgi:hypothetical protein